MWSRYQAHIQNMKIISTFSQVSPPTSNYSKAHFSATGVCSLQIRTVYTEPELSVQANAAEPPDSL